MATLLTGQFVTKWGSPPVIAVSHLEKTYLTRGVDVGDRGRLTRAPSAFAIFLERERAARDAGYPKIK